MALGWHVLALVHFTGNAFLRTYQLLVSPSVLNYLVHHQYFHYHPPRQKPVSGTEAALYMLGIKEWNLDTIMHKYLWSPFKWLGNQFRFVRTQIIAILLVLAGIAGLVISISKPSFISIDNTILSPLLMGIALVVVLFSFSYRGSALRAWFYILLAHLFVMASIGINTPHINSIEIAFYTSGIAAAFALGSYCLTRVKGIDNDISLNHYHGYVYEEKITALLFLLATIGILGFPLTGAFVAIDVYFTYVGSGQVLTITLMALCFIFIELAAIRIFLRIFLGQHKKLNHPVAFRSS